MVPKLEAVSWQVCPNMDFIGEVNAIYASDCPKCGCESAFFHRVHGTRQAHEDIKQLDNMIRADSVRPRSLKRGRHVDIPLLSGPAISSAPRK